MKHTFFATLLTAFSFSLTFGQLSLNANLSYGTGYRNNVFNSPSTYLDDGERLDADELIQSSLMHEIDGELFISSSNKRFQWDAGTAIWAQKMMSAPDGDQSRYALFFDLAYKKIKFWEFENELDVNRTQKVGVNVLGNELLQAFSYYALEDRLSATWDKYKNHESQLYVDFSHKRYDNRANVESLTHTQWSIGYKAEQVFKKNKRKRKLSLDISYRNRNYSQWTNTQLLKDSVLESDVNPFLPFDSTFSYPTRVFWYHTSLLSYSHYFGKKHRLKPYVEYKKRTDLSDGDFGYKQLDLGLYTYLHYDKYYIYSKFGFSNRNYTDRLAERQGGTPFPLLRYQYLRGKIKIERKLSDYFSLYVSMEGANRISNTTNELKRTRRSYINYTALAGISMELDKKIKKK